MSVAARRLLLVTAAGGLSAWVVLLCLERSYREQPWAFLEERLYVGSSTPEPPPGTTAVVNLCGQADPYSVDVHLWEPILEGGPKPTLDWLRRVVEFIHAQRQASRTVYVHCLAGINRSGMVVTAYLMHEHHWSRQRALAFVRSKRPGIRPDPELMQLLAEWEKSLAAAK